MKQFLAIIFFLILALNTFANSKCIKGLSIFINHKSIKLIIPEDGISDVIARVTKYYPSGVASPKNEEEFIELVNFARENQIELSVKGGSFSQGGQWAIEKGILVDTANYKGIKIIDEDSEFPSAIVRPGTTWKEIQIEADKLGLANTVQQSSNIFTVGGSLGINAHGRDISYGQIINVTNWIRVLLPDGKIVKASKDENPEIFKEVIGSLGLRGLILEASISLRPNKLVETVVLKDIPKKDIAEIFNLMRNDPKSLRQYIAQEDLEQLSFDLDDISADMIQMGYGRSKNLNLDESNYMDNALMYMFVEVPWSRAKESAKTKLKTNKDLKEELLPFLMEGQRLSNSMKSIREVLEEKFMRKSGAQQSLNYLMDPPVDFLLFKMKEDEMKKSGIIGKLLIYLKNLFRLIFDGKVDSTDILKEYFIPVSKLSEFEDALEEIIRKYELNNLNNTYRIVPKSTIDADINYAKTDSIAFVLNFNIDRDEKSLKNVDVWSQEIAQKAYELGGAHYLAYGADVSTEQLILTYPGFLKIFDAMIEDERKFGNVVFMNEYIRPFFNEYKERPDFFKNLHQ